MGGAHSRRKGHNFERYVANKFKPYFPKARRGLQYRDGMECPDVIGVPFHIECKRHKRVNIQRAFEQAVKETNGKPPIVVSKDDGGEELITFYLDDFLWMLRMAGHGEQR